MPVFSFKHIHTQQVVEVYIPITGQTNVYNGEDGTQTGVWKKCYEGNSSVNFGISTRIDPYSNKSFIAATDKKMTMGEMWDLSKEMSEKRAQKEGVDPVKNKNYKDYERKHGVKHQAEIEEIKKKRAKENMSKLGFEIEE